MGDVGDSISGIGTGGHSEGRSSSGLDIKKRGKKLLPGEKDFQKRAIGGTGGGRSHKRPHDLLKKLPLAEEMVSPVETNQSGGKNVPGRARKNKNELEGKKKARRELLGRRVKGEGQRF